MGDEPKDMTPEAREARKLGREMARAERRKHHFMDLAMKVEKPEFEGYVLRYEPRIRLFTCVSHDSFHSNF